MTWNDPGNFLAYRLFLYYAAGCVVSLCLQIASRICFRVTGWFLKSDTYWENLNKLGPLKDARFGARIWKWLRPIAWEVALSWISVALSGLLFLYKVLFLVREILLRGRTPEAVKKLRFPLENNPELSRETVWAHAFSLSILEDGRARDESQILLSLEEVLENHPRFDRMSALEQLRDIGVEREESVSRALAALRPQEPSA
jgi:hypothetical protein